LEERRPYKAKVGGSRPSAPTEKDQSRIPGIGIAQWTSAARRRGLFQHAFDGQQPGAAIVNSLDAQVDYLVSELRARAALNAMLAAAGVTVSDAADEVVYSCEIPGSILDCHGHRRPRNDPAAQHVFGERRRQANHTLAVYRSVHPG
jgi:hypothetical protein